MCDAGEELLQSPEILPLLAALGTIDNPGDNISVAAALLGPIYRFTPDEVAALRAEAPGATLWGALLQSGDAKAQRRLNRRQSGPTRASADVPSVNCRHCN